MADNVTFTPSAPTKAQATPTPTSKGDGSRQLSVDVAIPYTSYKSENHSPLTAEIFELGDNWQEFDEVGVIEDYFKEAVDFGDMDNTVEAVKERIKRFEKMINNDKTTRPSVRIAKLAAYLKFLKESDHIERRGNKYGGA